METKNSSLTQEERQAFDLYAAHALQALILNDKGLGTDDEVLATAAATHAVFLVGKRNEALETIKTIKELK
jgi:hypothetical protein